MSVAFTKPREQVHEFGRFDGPETSQRFVGHDQLGFGSHRHRDHHPTAGGGRQIRGASVEQGRNRLEPHLQKECLHAGAAGFAGAQAQRRLLDLDSEGPTGAQAADRGPAADRAAPRKARPARKSKPRSRKTPAAPARGGKPSPKFPDPFEDPGTPQPPAAPAVKPRPAPKPAPAKKPRPKKPKKIGEGTMEF